MKAALTTPFLDHLPLYPSTYMGYGAAVLRKRFELDIIDLNAEIYFKNRDNLNKILSDIRQNNVVIDNYLFYPFYQKLLNDVEKEYSLISWRKYQSIFITIPSWFINIPTENILKLTNFINLESPDSKIFFFGNSLGSWTDVNRLRSNKVNIIHLNDLFAMNPVNEPIHYDSLPTPIYEQREKYIFDIVPFRMKHGCIWGKCRFCSLAKGWNSGYKERSAKKVIQEIEKLNDKYSPKMLACNDNAINGNNLLEVCADLQKLDKPWVGMARADLSDKEIEGLQKSGCKLIYFGLESGSDSILKEINKGVSSECISNFIKKLYGNSITPAPSLFVGNPGETENDFEKTIKFILNHKNYIDILNVYPLMITPASDFSLMNKKPNGNILFRLSNLIKVCTEIGIKVCVGEQSAEYVFFKKIYSSIGSQ
ncbi:MAG: radical SAM protein [bacterium]|nr:MAG: radical SAM protein [bacterium]